MMSRGLPPPKNSDSLSEYEAEFMHWVLILSDMVALIQSENHVARKGKRQAGINLIPTQPE